MGSHPPSSHSPAASVTGDLPNTVTTRDFQTLGLNVHECRLTVIRSAAARNTRAFAIRQLKSPSATIDAQLWRTAHSAYRLMDPRKRTDAKQRAFVGRILPMALQGAGRTRFAVGIEPQIDPSPLLGPEDEIAANAATTGIATAEDFPNVDFDEPTVSLAHGMELDNHLARTLNSDDILNRSLLHQSVLRWRSAAIRHRRPIAAAASVLIITGSLLSIPSNEQVIDPVAAKHTTVDVPGLLATQDATDSDTNAAAVPAANIAEASAPETAPAGSRSIALNATPKDADPMTELVENSPPDDLVDNGLMPKEQLSEERLSESTPKQPSPTALATLDPLSPAETTPSETSLAEISAAETMPTEEMPAEAPLEDLEPNFLADPFAELASSESSPSSSGMKATDQPTATTNDASAPPRTPIPTQESIADAHQQLVDRIEPLQRTLPPEQTEAVLASLNDIVNDVDETSPTFWAAKMLAARTQWISGNAEQVQKTLLPLVNQFDVTSDQLLAKSFADVLTFREDIATHTHRIEQGFRLIDHLLVSEQFNLATDVSNALKTSIDFVGEEAQRETLRNFASASEQMVRLKKTTDLITDPNDNEFAADSLELISDSQAAIAGRYLCLMRYRWHNGLQWMAKGGDARLAPLAKQELSLMDGASVAEQIEIAQRWLAVSGRENGRAGESILLHSRELFKSARAKANRVQEIELDRKIAEIDAKLPGYLKAPIEPIAARVNRPHGPTVDEGKVDRNAKPIEAVLEVNSDVEPSDIDPTDVESEPSGTDSAELDFERALTKRQLKIRSSVSNRS